MTPLPWDGDDCCPECGEPDAGVSVECFEVFGLLLCPDCAADLFDHESEEDL